MKLSCESTLHRSVHRSQFDQHRTLCRAVWPRKFPETVLANALAFDSQETPAGRASTMRFVPILLGLAIALDHQSLAVHGLPVTVPLLEARGTTSAVPAAADDPVASALASRLAVVEHQLRAAPLVTSTAVPTSDEGVFLPSVRAKNIKQGKRGPFTPHLALTAPVDAIFFPE